MGASLPTTTGDQVYKNSITHQCFILNNIILFRTLKKHQMAGQRISRRMEETNARI